MNEHDSIPHLREIVVFLVAAGIVVPALSRIRVSPVLGYLVVGAVIGPFGLGLAAGELPWLGIATITDLDGVRALAELGVIFLLFVIGLELSIERLWNMRRLVFGLGSLQILVTAAVIGSIAWGFGNSPRAAIVLGSCLALSSTAIVMQLLIEQRRLGTPLGRTSFSILLMQDLAVVPILFVVGVLGARGGPGVGWALAVALFRATIVIIGVYLLGRSIVRPLFRMVARTRSAELFMAATLLMVIGTAAVTAAAGLSMALGAFLAGLLLAETEYRHEIDVYIEPFKGLLLGLFFMSVGMGIDYRTILDEPFWIAASVVGLFVIKSLITGTLCLMFKMPRHTSLEAGLLLGQGGEFAFVVVGLAMTLALLPTETGQFMLIVAGLTMLVTPLVAASASRLAEIVRRRFEQDDDEPVAGEFAGIEGHVVLVGFGRVGRTIGMVLDAEAIPFIALDLDPANVAAARERGLPVFFGDASRADMLGRVHADTAAALVLTPDDADRTDRIVRVARTKWPELPIHARARHRAHAARLMALGTERVVPETLEAGLQLAGGLLESLGTSEDAVRQRLDIQRELEVAELAPPAAAVG
ncbi:MAG: cation:proton antiporter [Gammaproteobacteria bacterium]|nr:cation:proton antiporter [Gammaproteobacteria bacterium]